MKWRVVLSRGGRRLRPKYSEACHRNGVDAIAYDKKAGVIFTSNGEANISVIQQNGPDKYTSFTNAATQGAKTMAISRQACCVLGSEHIGRQAGFVRTDRIRE